VSGTVVWQRLDRPTVEFLQWTAGPGLTLRGDVVGDLDGRVGRVRYRVQAGDDLLTKVVRLHVRFGSERHRLSLARNPEGRWQANGLDCPHLAGATDVDIGVTPATNTLPIRRLGLGVGESQEVIAAWVRFPDLSMWRAHQQYTRTGPRLYRYESLDSGYQAELTVQEDGIVEQYAEIWRVLP